MAKSAGPKCGVYMAFYHVHLMRFVINFCFVSRFLLKNVYLNLVSSSLKYCKSKHDSSSTVEKYFFKYFEIYIP